MTSSGLDSTLQAVLGHGHRLEHRTDSSLGSASRARGHGKVTYTSDKELNSPPSVGLTADAPTGCKRQEVPRGAGGCCRGTGTRCGQGCRGAASAPHLLLQGWQPAGLKSSQQAVPCAGTKPDRGNNSALKVIAQVTHPQGHDFQARLASNHWPEQPVLGMRSLCLIGPGCDVQPAWGTWGASGLLHTEKVVTGTHSPLSAPGWSSRDSRPVAGCHRHLPASSVVLEREQACLPRPTPAAGRGQTRCTGLWAKAASQHCVPGCRCWGKEGTPCFKACACLQPPGVPSTE